MPLPTLQISLGIVALFEKIYYELPILIPSSQISGRMYNTVVSIKCVKSVSQPDTMPLFANNYSFQMTETGFADLF